MSGIQTLLSWLDVVFMDIIGYWSTNMQKITALIAHCQVILELLFENMQDFERNRILIFCALSMCLQVQRVQILCLIGEEDLLSAWVLLEVLHSFMKNLCHILCIETLKQVIYFLTKTLTPKLETLVWLSFSQRTSLILAQEQQEQRTLHSLVCLGVICCLQLRITCLSSTVEIFCEFQLSCLID